MLAPLIPKGKENDKNHVIAVGPWLDNCRELLRVADVPAKWHSALGQQSIPATKGQQFRQWCKDKDRDQEKWATFEEFIYKEYSGIVSTLDAYAKWKSLPAPRNSDDLDNFVDKFKLYARMSQLKEDSPQVAMEFITRMPSTLFQRILGQSSSDDSLSLPMLVTMAGMHFRSLEVARATPMEVDAIEKNPLRGPSGLPHFSLVKHLCTLEQYNDRAKRNVCLGCGGDHQWRKCQHHPKGRED
ncbi:hypothetical protein GGI06_005458 [Coemansia sp. S85]|nr:hypothetical protein GGI06_005458 [Coemansia sp. S85]